MSESNQPTTLERTPFFRPRTFLVGLLAGLVLCSAIARTVSQRSYHRGFLRFFPAISPEAQYYPTIEEMRGIVRTACRPDQVLVVVGGNSIFNGVGQPPEKLWTVELQRLLGDRYGVVNLAFRGAMCTDAGAAVAESLRHEFPRQIYIANSAPLAPPAPYGLEPYRYMIWEARSRGLLETFAARDALIADYKRDFMSWGQRFDVWGLGWLDRGLRFRDLWNWVGYRYIFTIRNPVTPHMMAAVWPRRDFEDHESDFEDIPTSDRFRPENNDIEMKITRAFSQHFLLKDWKGNWRPIPLLQREFEGAAKGAFPDDLKARTLIMLSRNSSVYLRQLSADELRREDAAYSYGVAEWKKMGYASADYGRDYEDGDFGDRTHLTATGGRKLAAQVADQVRQISMNLGYLGQTTSHP